MTISQPQRPSFAADEVIRVLGLPPEEVRDFNDIDYLHFYRAGQDVCISTATLRLYRDGMNTVWWDT